MVLPTLNLREKAPKTVTLNRNVLIVGGGVLSFVVISAMVLALSDDRHAQPASVQKIPLESQRAPAENVVTSLFDGDPQTYADLQTDSNAGSDLDLDIDYDTDETTIDYGFSDPVDPPVVEYIQPDMGPSPAEIAAAEARASELKRAWESPIAADLGADFSTRGTSVVPASSGLPDLSALQNPADNAEQAQAGLPTLSLTAEGNDPARKLQFGEQNFSGATHVNNPYLSPSPFSREVKAGTTIAASLVTGINSDLPGTITARVTRPIYDSVTGRDLLIPQGTRLLGRYDSILSFEQDRVQIAWFRLILPNGGSIQLDNMPGVDQSGYAGIGGKVNNHLGSIATGIGISTTISGLASLLTNSIRTQDTAVDASIQAVQSQSSAVSNSITERYLNRQPTITVEPGTPVFLLLTKDLQLPTYRRS